MEDQEYKNNDARLRHYDMIFDKLDRIEQATIRLQGTALILLLGIVVMNFLIWVKLYG